MNIYKKCGFNEDDVKQLYIATKLIEEEVREIGAAITPVELFNIIKESFSFAGEKHLIMFATVLIHSAPQLVLKELHDAEKKSKKRTG